jgi:hypothetical protein
MGGGSMAVVGAAKPRPAPGDTGSRPAVTTRSVEESNCGPSASGKGFTNIYRWSRPDTDSRPSWV